jgi:cytochrome c oxidase assembly factor CtaG/ferredoxin
LDPVSAAVLRSWSFEPGLLVAGGLVAVLYLRGFREVREQLPARFPPWRAYAFLAGLGAVGVALLSPLDALADLLLQVHMVQHWLLMMVAPPLLWLGAPTVPLLRGLPRRWLRDGVGPFLAWPALRRFLDLVTRPAVAFALFAATTVLWHLPAAYQAALRSRGWHDFEHGCFLLASLLFWYAVVRPWPARDSRTGHPGASILLLGAAAVFNTIFSAVFAFSGRLFYPAYAAMPRPWGIDPVTDQNGAGAFLWIAGTIPMLVAVVALIFSWLEPRPAVPSARPPRRAPPARGRSDLLAMPWLGRTLRSRAARRALQALMLLLAALVVADGLLGSPQPSARNLAGVLPWTYWRGLFVIGLLVLGNVFCAVCPFTLSRSLAARWLGNRFAWPRGLRNKWLPVAGFLVFLWSYEVFALWDRPFWTAWIVVGYFAACFAVEGLFPRGTFCRYVCPIGQFQFTGASVSPFQVEAKDPAVCASCRTHDCLRGNAGAPGCPTGLFLPTKTGSQDCTTCLDCVRACPHDNGGLLAVLPGEAVGRSRHPGLDLAALALLFSAGAFVNAAAMVAPVVAAEASLAAWLGATSRLPAVSLTFALGLVALPVGLAWSGTWLGRRIGRSTRPVGEIVARLAPSLVPMGFAMWLAHFAFHLASGFTTLGPAARRAAREAGLANLSAAPAGSVALFRLDALLSLEIAALGVGLLISLGVALRIVRELATTRRAAVGLAAPWATLAAGLYVTGVWILLQPMEMRGMVMP